MSHLYQQAVQAIRNAVDSKQAELDAAASAARVACLNAYRRDLLAGVDPASPAFAVCSLASTTVTVGREDGYPAANLPKEVRQAIVAAYNAGILTGDRCQIRVGSLAMHRDASGFKLDPIEASADYEAWDASRSYRHHQTVHTL